MSVRPVSLTPRPNRAFSSFAGSGASAPAPKFLASFAGEVALYLSLRPIGMMTSLISGLPRRLTCTQSALARRLPCAAHDGDPLALGRRPDADDGVAGARPGHAAAVARHVGLLHLQRERVRVVARDVVLAAALVAQADAGTARLVDVDAVERDGEVDEERVVGRAHEGLAAVRDRLDGAGRDLAVVGDRLRPDVVGRDRQVVRDPQGALQLAPAVVGLAVEVVRLDEVEVRIVDRVDRRRRVEERVRVAEPLAELPPVRDVLAAVAGVVDLDVVARLRIELAEVRAARRVLERDPVRDDRQVVRRVGRRERVEVRVVRRRVGEDRRGLAVTRAAAARSPPATRRPGRPPMPPRGWWICACALLGGGLDCTPLCAPRARAVLRLVASGSRLRGPEARRGACAGGRPARRRPPRPAPAGPACSPGRAGSRGRAGARRARASRSPRPSPAGRASRPWR